MAKKPVSGKPLRTYLVGGAVRDHLLQRPVQDRDYVVVGATPEQLLAQGYVAVGKDFPVFLHPKTKQEYALARTERKQGQGYTGFACYFAADVTLEQDLLRRDLTINAMAMDEQTGELFDPYGGQQDLQAKLLRHVSDAFVEDPLRVLRVARFLARFAHLGFQVADETKALLRELSVSGELEHLTAERVWQETARALTEQTPAAYFELLRQVGALRVLLPELDCLWGVPNPPKWHPEIDTGIHTMLVLTQAALQSPRLDIRFAALMHDLGKGLTPPSAWPSHHGHEHSGLKPIEQVCQRLRVPNDCKELALMACEFHQLLHRALQLKASTLLKLFDGIDLWRKPERLDALLQVAIADLRGRTGFEQADYPPADYLRAMAQAARAVDIKAIVAQGFQGEQIREQVQRARLNALKQTKQHYQLEESEGEDA
jgi:tRNA nucleotidyltransferase (CCA-adding enzyme)